MLKKGDLLLLADRPGEAKQGFGQAADIAANDAEHLTAVEGIARAIRADCGCVGPANAYILAESEAAGYGKLAGLTLRRSDLGPPGRGQGCES